MKLSKVPLADIKAGDRCVSAIGTMGVITSVDTQRQPHGNLFRVGWIKISWDNKKTSQGWYDDGDGTWYWDNVEYLGR